MNKEKTKKITTKKVKLSEEEFKAFKEAEDIINNINMADKKQHHWHIILVCLIIFAIIFFFFSTIFSLVRATSTTIANGVYIENIDISNLTIEEAKEKITKIYNDNLNTELSLIYEDYKTTISPNDLHVNYTFDEALESAYSIGRSGNVFKNNYAILNAMLSTVHIKPTVSYDSNLLTSTIQKINVEIPGAINEPSYSIDGTTLYINKGKDGIAVLSAKLKNDILYSLSNIYSGNNIINIPTKYKKADEIDIDKIHSEIYKAPVDAHYTANPYVFYPSSTGIDFDVSIDEAKRIVSENKDQYIIPLKVLYPNVYTYDIGLEAFPDLLSEFSTDFSYSNYNRSTNIILASQEISGYVLMPGDTFSYNDVVGQRTAERGFRAAAAYSGGKVVQEIGGGICQVSSTLYNAVLYANLEIVERSNHLFQPSYVDSGLDATVSWGGPDFKFKNNRNYPIKIIIDPSDGEVHVWIYGLRTESDVRVVLDAVYLYTIYPTTEYEKDPNLGPGEEVVKQWPEYGCRTETYKYLYDANDNLISSECISEDVYDPHNKVIAIGE